MNEALEAVTKATERKRKRLKTSDVDELPQEEELTELTITGMNAFYMMHSQRRMVLKDTAIRLESGLETPGGVARGYLLWKFKGSPSVRAGQVAWLKGGMPAPAMYAAPCKFEHGYYIDIQSSYFSLMQVIGWDLDYWPEKWLARGTPPHDFPFPRHKPARSALVSCAIGTGLPCYNPEAKRGVPWTDPYKPMEAPNPVQNLQLWRLVRDVLAAIACEAVVAGAVYANVDGYIVTTDQARNRVLGIIADWGLKARVKAQGAGRVLGNASYDVGKEKHTHGTGSTGSASARPPQEVRLLPYRSWLQKRFSPWAAKAGKVLESE